MVFHPPAAHCRTGARAIRQVAALPYRIEGVGADAGLRVLLVTSRHTGRWVVPKGNVPDGMGNAAAAAQEALEEAGVRGRIAPEPVGEFRYRKWRARGGFRLVKVVVHPLLVTEELEDWLERSQRERRWFSAAGAADLVDERELRAILRAFRPAELAHARSGHAVSPRSRLARWWRAWLG